MSHVSFFIPCQRIVYQSTHHIRPISNNSISKWLSTRDRHLETHFIKIDDVNYVFFLRFSQEGKKTLKDRKVRASFTYPQKSHKNLRNLFPRNPLINLSDILK